MDQDTQYLEYAAAIYSKDPKGVLGPWLLGALGDAFFIGLLWTQLSTYFHLFPRDSKYTKSLVIVVAVLSCLKFGQTCYTTWDRFTIGFGDWISIVRVGWDTYVRYAVAPFDNPQIQRYSTPQLSLNVLNDFIISIVVTVKLSRSRTGFNPNTDSALTRLLTITWGAGIPPTISATLDMITFFAMPLTLIHVFFNLLTGRLYVFSMMYALNSRAVIRDILSQSPVPPSQEVSCTVPKFRTPGMTSSTGSDSMRESRFQPLGSMKVDSEASKSKSDAEEVEEVAMSELTKSHPGAFKVSAFQPDTSGVSPSDDELAQDSKGRSQWV
ncbi:hypothetical protein FRB90_001714 [Tulasnella sp. 427]|nr:hypothetical protein FRB90_001714 [Tulasnella sp. 427]